jgi:hypothetical protein
MMLWRPSDQKKLQWCEMEMSGHGHDGSHREYEGRGQRDDGENALVYWRMLPANRIGTEAKQTLLTCISHISATSDEWRKAIRGDAAAAVSLALRLETPSMMSYRVDLVMTLLLRAALDDAAAATVMAHRLAAMPLNAKTRSKLATSWLLHCIWLDSRRQRRSGRPASKGSELP